MSNIRCDHKFSDCSNFLKHYYSKTCVAIYYLKKFLLNLNIHIPSLLRLSKAILKIPFCVFGCFVLAASKSRTDSKCLSFMTILTLAKRQKLLSTRFSECDRRGYTIMLLLGGNCYKCGEAIQHISAATKNTKENFQKSIRKMEGQMAKCIWSEREYLWVMNGSGFRCKHSMYFMVTSHTGLIDHYHEWISQRAPLLSPDSFISADF